MLAGAVLSAAASGYLALAGFFDALRDGVAVVACVAVVAGIAVGGTASSLLMDRDNERALAKRLTLRSALDAACLAFHAATSEGAEKFGADLLLVDAARWRPRELWTAVHGGFAQHPPTRIAWTHGKGVVGRCWESGSTVFVDLDRLLPGPDPASDEAWRLLDDAVRMGLSRDEWMRVRPYFGSIVAACIFDASRAIVGVAAVYGPAGLDLSAYEPELRSATEALAVTLAGLLE